jgi:hypothetical protein
VDEQTAEGEVEKTPEEEVVNSPEPTCTQDEKEVAEANVKNEETAAVEVEENEQAVAKVDEVEQAVVEVGEDEQVLTVIVTEDTSATSGDLVPLPGQMEDVQRTRQYMIQRVPRDKFIDKLVPASILGKHDTDAIAPSTKKHELGAVAPMEDLTFSLAVLDLNLPHKWGLVKLDNEKFFGKEVPAETLGKRPAGYDDEDGEDEIEEEAGSCKKVKMSPPVGVPMVRRRVYRVR